MYVDAQNDGQLDPGDPPIANDTITLTGFNDQGPVSETTKTASDGSYSFTNLRPGTYGITQTQPSGYVAGATTVGSPGRNRNHRRHQQYQPWLPASTASTTTSAS